MKLPAYPEYKPSGVGWLGGIPGHWEVTRLKRVARMKAGSAITTEGLDQDSEYPVYGGNGLRGYTSSFTHDGERVLVGRQGALCGNVNYATGRFWASEHAVVVTPVSDIHVRWLGELLRSMNLNQYSIAAAQPGIAIDDIQSLEVARPPLHEQRAIADFLDVETAKLDTLTAKKRELIEKLKEKRSALISRTVTRGLPPEAARAAGLNPNSKLKFSGLEWLGEIPEHWEICKFSREIQVAEGQVDPEVEPYVSMLLIAPNHIESATGKLLLKTAAEQGAESGKYLCRVGEVIYSKIRPALAKVAIAPENCLCSADMYPLSGSRRFENRYIYWLFLSQQFTAWSVLESDRVAMPKINRETLGELRLSVPPISEQRAIADYLDRETEKIDRMVAKVEEAIERLQEYRTALITAAVTGKIDVRGCGRNVEAV